MNTNLKFGLSQVNNHAPTWLINATSIVAILITAKHFLIDGLPGLEDETKLLAKAWFEYGLNIIQVLLALSVIFLGKKEKTHHDSTRNINN